MPKGLVKAKKYDWKDSNMALFGSDTEKQVKKESAETEPAWQGAGQEPGLKIWRIEQFEVKDWDQKNYGSFYNGDSYIVLNTYKEEETEELKFDVHFWIGKNSTQDEYGTVAYKTVELDTFLDDAPVQHREVQGHESSLFKSYFPAGIMTMEGGAESGFNHVEPETYEPRLLHFNGKGRNISVREVPLSKKSLRTGDVYILDLGKRFIQYNGSGCNIMEKSKAMEFLGKLKNERGSSDDTVIDEGDGCPEFFDALSEDDIDDDSDDEDDGDGDKKLLKLNAEGTFDEVKTGDISKDDFVSEDVFLLDTPSDVFIWIGSGASPDEKKNGFPRAHDYMKTRPKVFTPLTVIKEGGKSAAFEVAISA
ncbi:gelsolin-like protein 2 [Haliotis rufescens]|uniref:gelsolin-like protein 2 n=1 Tax=Haliotis rufescens TaxID=6454 RepID=UPI00201EE154|nr:gelsolin-like protein 2 [Haliotis rufescens]XP_046363483.2 gelsolin-like protein 2 [Haliotis rufescens]XP_046363485.2 gelsolin-like protein 2 [Haliotis rufescens]